MTMINFIF